MPCMARRGFLTLRDCGNPEERLCASCSRPMCHEHLAARSDYTQCLECAAFATKSELDPSDPEWPYAYRRGYYHDYGYAPFYFGSTQYGDYDVRSFDRGANQRAVADRDDEGKANFGDS